MKRIMGVGVAMALLSAGAVAAAATPAAAGPACNTSPVYKVGNKKTVWVPTNLHSDWLGPGVGTTYTSNKTGTWSVSGTWTVGAQAKVIFATVSSSFSVQVGKSWSQSSSWSYTATVPKSSKRPGRLMLFHEAKGFSLSKNHFVATGSGQCKLHQDWKKFNLKAPVKRHNNKWGIQYQS